MNRNPNVAAVGLWETRLLGLVAVSLATFGLGAIYSASSIWAVQGGDAGSTYAIRQLIGVVLGVAALLVATRIDYHVWRANAWALIGIAAFLLMIPLLPFTRAIAPELNGARRWLQLGPVSLQPSEFAKFAVIAWTAMLAAKKGAAIRHFKTGLLPFLVVLVPVSGLVLLEPDLSTACLLLLLAGIVLFTGGARIGHFLVLGLLALPFIWQWIVSAQYRFQRMMSFLSPGSGEWADASWQIKQSLIGIGAGRLIGVGVGQGLQKLGYLPYAYSDFIFSNIAEEWGFVGVVLILACYGTFVAIGFRIARYAPDRFGMLLATGLTALIGLTALLHIAVTLSLVPTTGLPLPFVSYGRSNLLVSLFAAGILINIGAGGSRARRVR